MNADPEPEQTPTESMDDSELPLPDDYVPPLTDDEDDDADR